MNEYELERALRADLNRLRAERDELCAELAAGSAELAALRRQIGELRGFEAEYRRRLTAWVDTALGLLNPDRGRT